MRRGRQEVQRGARKSARLCGGYGGEEQRRRCHPERRRGRRERGLGEEVADPLARGIGDHRGRVAAGRAVERRRQVGAVAARRDDDAVGQRNHPLRAGGPVESVGGDAGDVGRLLNRRPHLEHPLPQREEHVRVL